MQEISSHAFNRNDWLCLYLSLAFAVLERCVPTFLCGRKRWFKKEVVITALNVIKHFYHSFDNQILEHNSESFLPFTVNRYFQGHYLVKEIFLCFTRIYKSPLYWEIELQLWYVQRNNLFL